MVETARDKVGARELTGLLGLALMNGLNLNTVPLINGVWTDRLHFDPGGVGLLLTVQLVTSAIASIALSTRLHRIAPRRSGIIAGVILVGTNLWFACQSGYAMLLIGSIVAGAALGCLTACGTAALAAAGQVGRTAAIVSISATVLVAALTVPAAHAADTAGKVGLFGAQAAVAAAAVGLTLLLPARGPSDVGPRAVPLFRAMRSPFVAAAICLDLGSAGIWAFTERIGSAIGLTPRVAGDIIAAASLFAIGGAVAATLLARPGRERALAIVATLAFGASSSAVALAPNMIGFLAALGAQAFFFVFSGPFITAVGIALDRSGGLAAAAHGWGVLVGALAPTLSGILVESGHFEHLAVLGAVTTLLSVAALTMATGRADLPERSTHDGGPG